MATATEAKPADYAPLTRAGHNAETVLEVEGLQTYLFTRLGVGPWLGLLAAIPLAAACGAVANW